MATQTIHLPKGVWTLISGAGTSGMAENSGNRAALIQEQELEPASGNLDGHRLVTRDTVDFSLNLTNSIWGLSTNTDGVVTVTLD